MSKKNILSKRGTKVAAVTFGLFMTEALLHYNLGQKDVKGLVGSTNDLEKIENKGFLPDAASLAKIAAIVAIFSGLNAVLLSEKKSPDE